jgi:adenylosuccinate synthase
VLEPKSQNVTVVVGIQWGDEGKGRVVDLLARDADIVARFGGGDNAGHTLVVGDRKLALRIVPSGVLVARPQLLIGSGTVVSLASLVTELDSLAQLGVDLSRIHVAERAHIVFPYHVLADRQGEAARGGAAIGTTGRGIGPAYVDKAARVGITFGDLRRPAALADKLRMNLLARGSALAATSSVPSEEDLLAETLRYAERLRPHIVDGVAFIHDALEAGKTILAEGAQGTMLDVGFGTYPFVTSSHTIAGAATIGLGIGPKEIGRVIGIAKAYCTRVGAGPFPSELQDEAADRLRTRGGEFGTVTGRPRRCGWFDAVAARYAVRLNGTDSVIITKLDVLSGLERIGVVTRYQRGGRSEDVGAMAEPGLEVEIEWFEGWDRSIGDARRMSDLPPAARRYLKELERLLGVPIEGASVGPEREQYIAAVEGASAPRGT